MSEHAVLAPSSAPIWGNCSGSVQAQAGLPDDDTPEKRRGRAGHWVAAQCLLHWRDVRDARLFCDSWVGETDPEGTVIDEDIAAGAQVLVDDVLQVAQEHGALQAMRIEHRVHMPQVHPTHNWGTLDVAIVLPRKFQIYLWDYKAGHREVSAVENLQLIDYAAGLINELQIDGLADQVWYADFRIVQPFCYHATDTVDRWVVKLADLRPYFNQLAFKAAEALSMYPKFTSGQHCRDCKAVRTCPTARKMTYSLHDYVDEPYRFDRMTGADLAVERGILARCVSVAKSRLEAIEDELQQRIKAGDTSTGFTVEGVVGRLEWSVPDEIATVFAAQFGADISKPGIVTPTQAEKKVPLEKRAAFIKAREAIASRPAAGTKLVPVEKSRTARAFTKATR